MRTIAPGESLIYRFTATRAGIWMYHCSTMPMSAHIANGMFGAVVIDPPGLPPVDREYVLVQSELYLGPQGGPVDVDKLRGRAARTPSSSTATPNQYDHRPLHGAGRASGSGSGCSTPDPTGPSSFHVVGGQFDTVYTEGALPAAAGAGRGRQPGARPRARPGRLRRADLPGARALPVRHPRRWSTPSAARTESSP